ncbi:transposase [Streptomyces sp. NPDC006283]|uniref:transposase n=1 Tax=Streptomyces sp. NPDC006283 TaxID=3156741 RepID=UPI00339FD8E0
MVPRTPSAGASPTSHPEVTHREKWRLALDTLDTLGRLGMRPPVVVAGATYGTNAHLRAALSDRGIEYSAVRADVCAQPLDAKPVPLDRNGPVGCWAPATATPHPRWPPLPPASDRRHSPPSPGGRAREESYVPA